MIVDKIDFDKDGFLTLVELKDWIRYTQKRYIDDDTDRHWQQHNPNNEELLPWEVSIIYIRHKERWTAAF